jgi:hypothetical protein
MQLKEAFSGQPIPRDIIRDAEGLHLVYQTQKQQSAVYNLLHALCAY